MEAKESRETAALLRPVESDAKKPAEVRQSFT